MLNVTEEAVAFMREHAGFSYGPGETEEEGKERGARALARAEAALKADSDVFVVWEVDDIDSSDFEDTGEPYALWRALLCIDCDRSEAQVTRGYDPRDSIFERYGRIVEVLGGIDLGRNGHPIEDPYVRVIEAELYSEFQATRDEAVVRGEN